MKFEDMRVKKLEFTARYRNHARRWVTQKRINHILGVQLQGKAIHDFGYQKFVISTGCLYFLNQKDEYSVEVLEDCSAFSVHFTTVEPIETDSFCLPVKSTVEMVNLLERIEAQVTAEPGGNHLAMSDFHRLCALFVEQYRKAYQPGDVRVTKAKEWIDLHFREESALEDAAKISGISRRRFNELFRKQFGITPNRYLTVRKIELAKSLLHNGTISVADTAEQCGFRDIYYFSKVFHAETGMSPTEYRKRGFEFS